jgi:hypothetical protein
MTSLAFAGAHPVNWSLSIGDVIVLAGVEFPVHI